MGLIKGFSASNCWTDNLDEGRISMKTELTVGCIQNVLGPTAWLLLLAAVNVARIPKRSALGRMGSGNLTAV